MIRANRNNLRRCAEDLTGDNNDATEIVTDSDRKVIIEVHAEASVDDCETDHKRDIEETTPELVESTSPTYEELKDNRAPTCGSQNGGSQEDRVSMVYIDYSEFSEDGSVMYDFTPSPGGPQSGSLDLTDQKVAEDTILTSQSLL